jgi:pimeloyl-ACP methyl ester carboxylesterase
LYGSEQQVTSAVVDSGHDYNKAMRELLYRHVAKYLLGRQDENITEPDDLPVEPTSALRVGLPANSETMQSLTYCRAAELVREIKQPRDAQQWRELKRDQQNRLRKEVLGGFPDTRDYKKTLVRTLKHNGQLIEHWTFEPEPRIVVPAALCLPQDAPTGGRRPAVIIVDENGKRAAFESGIVDALVNRGFMVLAIDYRGAGETAGTVPAIGFGPPMPEYNLTNYSLFVGRPLAGSRVADVRCATEFLTSRTDVAANRIAIVGRGRGALSAVLAASFDDRLRCVVADEFVTSLVFKEEFLDIGLEYFIPDLLTVADMPQLLADLAPRPLLISNPVDGRRRAVSIDDCNEQLRFTSSVYKVSGANDSLRISRSSAQASASNLAEWLRIHN